MELRRIRAEETRPLRQQVLRPGVPLEQLALPGEDDPASAHFAAVEGGRILAVASVLREPGAPPGDRRIRAVATAPEARGRGLGRRVVMACVEHAQRQGATRIWLQAAPDVVAWYERLGFARDGAPYVIERGPRQRLTWRGGDAP